MDRRSSGGESLVAPSQSVASAGARVRPATWAKRTLRIAVSGGALVVGSLALMASCSSSGPTAVGPDGAVSDASGRSPTCPALPDPSQCTGADPAVVFAPPPECDPSTHDGGTIADAGMDDSGDGGTDPCALVTTLSVFPTPATCRAFIAAEASGNLDSETSAAAPFMVQPDDGAMLTKDAWSTFVWTRIVTDARRGPVERALDLLEPSAYAAPPVNGDVYVLEFSQGCHEVLRAIVTSTFWTPDPVSWATLSALHGSVNVQVFWLSLNADVLTRPPVPGKPIAITMQAAPSD